MALAKCKECEREVSTQAEKCPNCGAPIKKKGIGGFGFVILSFLFMAVVFALGSKVDIGDKTTFSSNPQKSTTQKKPEIATSDFEVISFSQKWERGRLVVLGEIRNNGKIAGGPQVEVIARNKNGELVASSSFWPNSINNIPPGGTCGIYYNITEDQAAKETEIKVIRAKIWR